MAKFKVKTKDGIGYKLLRWLSSKFKKCPEFTFLSSSIPPKSIIIGNHSGAKGAFTYRTFMNTRFMTWGAHQMCEGYNSRRKYLYHTFYRQKLGYGKFKAFMLSITFALISGIVYSLAGIIPVYYDLNIIKTFRHSFDCINQNVPVFIFPENSSNGYNDIIEEFYPGFLALSQLYYNKYNIDLPILTLYFSRHHNRVVVGKAMYLQELRKQFGTDKEIVNYFREYMNSLYKYIQDDGTAEQLKEVAMAEAAGV